MTNVSNPIPYEIPYENTTTSCFEEVVTASTLGIPSYKWMLGNSRFVYGKKSHKSSHRRMGGLLQSRTTETDTLSSAVVALISRKEEQESAVQIVVLSNPTKVDVDLS